MSQGALGSERCCGRSLWDREPSAGVTVGGDTLGPLQSLCQPPAPSLKPLWKAARWDLAQHMQHETTLLPPPHAAPLVGLQPLRDPGGPRASETPQRGTAAALSLVSRAGPEGQRARTHTHRAIAAHGTALT